MIAKYDGLELRRCEVIKRIAAPEISPKSLGTLNKQAVGYIGNEFFSNYNGPKPHLPIDLPNKCHLLRNLPSVQEDLLR